MRNRAGDDSERSRTGYDSELGRARYVREAEHRKAYARQYLRDRPGYAAEQKRRRKARLALVPVYVFTERDWQRMKARYRNACSYCGATGTKLQRDHVIPLAKGGSHGVGNIVPACPPCNYGKHTSLAVQWKRRLRQREGVNVQCQLSS